MSTSWFISLVPVACSFMNAFKWCCFSPFMLKRLLCPKLLSEATQSHQNKEWQSLLVELPLGHYLPFSLKVSGTCECEVRACSCLTWSHEKTSSAKKDILGPVVAKSGQECGLWFLNLRNKLKRICLKVAGPMTPGRSGLYLHVWDVSR